MTTRPTKPLDPVTSVTVALILRLPRCSCDVRKGLSPIIRLRRHLGEGLARIGGAANELHGTSVLVGELARKFCDCAREQVVSSKLNRGRNLDGACAGEHHARNVDTVLRSND